MPAGRPRKFDSPEEMQAVVDAYFADPNRKKTICGLALEMGFTTRQSIYDYIKRDDEYSDIMRVACLKVENWYEEHLTETACAGSIFCLKNMGWTDRQDITSGGEPFKMPSFTIKMPNE